MFSYLPQQNGAQTTEADRDGGATLTRFQALMSELYQHTIIVAGGMWPFAFKQ